MIYGKKIEKARKRLEDLTDEQLASAWSACDQQRVKTGPNKGQITMRALKFSDAILAEQNRRAANRSE